MNDWEHITKHAILGTQRQPFSLPKSPLSSLWAQLETAEPAEKLLHSAALLTEYRRLGWQPSTIENPPLAPSQAETLPQCTPKAVELFRSILQENNSNIQSALLKEWLRLAQAAGQRVPFQILPVLLDKAKQDETLQPYLTDTIGQRGHWLAKLNPDWQDFSDTQPDVQVSWETGSHAARLTYLQQCRATDPAQARELLAATWQQETAQARQAFLATFWTQLSLEDETFLENCLKDRSQVVRQLAAQMLGSLKSRFLKQLLERLSAYFSVKKTTLEINLPSEYYKAWTREGIKEKPPSSSKMGQKAWWLYQMLLSVRPSFLLAHFELSVETYLKILRKTDFADMLFDALTVATKTHQDQSVAAVLVQQSKRADVFLKTLTDMAEALPEDERDTLLQTFLKTRKVFTNWTQVSQIVNLFPNGMSRNLSLALLTNLSRLLKKKNSNYYGYSDLLSLAAVLAPSCYDDMLQENTEQHPAIENFLKIYHFRAQMTQEFTQ
jgi:hypothetical protein